MITLPSPRGHVAAGSSLQCPRCPASPGSPSPAPGPFPLLGDISALEMSRVRQQKLQSYTRTAQAHSPQLPMPHSSTAVTPVTALSFLLAFFSDRVQERLRPQGDWHTGQEVKDLYREGYIHKVSNFPIKHWLRGGTRK